MSTVSSAPASRTLPADPAYAWVMLPLAIVMHVGTSPGQTYGVSVFNEAMRESLQLTHSQLTGSYLIASVLAAVPLVMIGRLMDRYGLRRVSLVLVALVGLACLAISQVEGTIGLTASFFMLRAFGQGGLSLAATNTLAMWFYRRLGIAVGIAGIGTSVAIATVPLVYLFMVHHFGWRTAYAILGVAIWLVLLPLLAVLYKNNEMLVDEGQLTVDQSAQVPSLTASPRDTSFDQREAVRTRSYWIAAACSALTGVVLTGVFFNLTALFEWRGLTAGQAAATYTTIAVAMALLQLKGGVLSDWLPLRSLLAMAMAMMAGGVLLFGYVETMWTAQVAAALLGGGHGLLAAVSNTLWPRYFGRRHLGTIRSTVSTASIAACAVGPFIMGVTQDWLGSYGPSLALFSVLMAGAAVAAVGATPPRRELVLSATDVAAPAAA